jgi:hypothetical protein
MPKEKTLKESYDECTAKGSILPQDRVDLNMIKTISDAVSSKIRGCAP